MSSCQSYLRIQNRKDVFTRLLSTSHGSHDSTSQNHEKATSENQVKPIRENKEGDAFTPAIRRRWRAAFFHSAGSSHDLPSLSEGEEDEGKDEVDCLRNVASASTSPRASTSSDLEDHESTATTGHKPSGPSLLNLLRKGTVTVRLQTLPLLHKRKTKRISDLTVPALDAPFDPTLFKSSWKNFTIAELQAATDNFSRENLIGQGGYAEVFKGELEDGQLVAIKRLTRGSPEEMTMDFLSELGIIVHVDHPSIAKLIGYGVEGGMYLVLELSLNGSLASTLYGAREKLDWGIRFKIALGTAEGIAYLHKGCQRRIIHKDIKAANILLTEDFMPQIIDFGLAKWLPDQWTHHTVEKIEGTFGYLPPEFFMHGIVDEKTDVFAYGVLVLELITGKQALDGSQKSLVMWAKPLISKNKFTDLVDPVLGEAYDLEQLNKLVLIAGSCIHESAVNRPQMIEVVDILNGNGRSYELLKFNHRKNNQRSHSDDFFDAEEFNSINHLSEMGSVLDSDK